MSLRRPWCTTARSASRDQRPALSCVRSPAAQRRPDLQDFRPVLARRAAGLHSPSGHQAAREAYREREGPENENKRQKRQISAAWLLQAVRRAAQEARRVLNRSQQLDRVASEVKVASAARGVRPKISCCPRRPGPQAARSKHSGAPKGLAQDPPQPPSVLNDLEAQGVSA